MIHLNKADNDTYNKTLLQDINCPINVSQVVIYITLPNNKLFIHKLINTSVNLYKIRV